MVHQSFDSVSVTFNELIDPATAELNVSACGENVDDENVTVTGFTVEVGIVDNPVGTYTLSYSVSGADDTPGERENPSKDSFPFTYHSKDCGDDDENGGHDGHGDDKKDENHSGKHSDKTKHGKHKKNHGGTGGSHESGHMTNSSHDDHGAFGNHKDDHENDGHNDGNHGSRHKDNEGKHDPKHSDGHGDKGDKDETGGGAGPNKDGPGSKTSARVSPWINLSVVLLLPALVGLIGGRRLRQLNLRPSG